MAKRKELNYETRRICKRNKQYPKVRLLCGEVERIKDANSVPERLVQGDWLMYAHLK